MSPEIAMMIFWVRFQFSKRNDSPFTARLRKICRMYIVRSRRRRFLQICRKISNFNNLDGAIFARLKYVTSKSGHVSSCGGKAKFCQEKVRGH